MITCEAEMMSALTEVLCQRISLARYKLWFEDKTKFAWENDLLTVGVPNHFYQDWLQKTFGEEVRASACAVLGQPMRIRFTIDPELFRANHQKVSGEASGGVSGVMGGGEVSGQGQDTPHTHPITPHPSLRTSRPNLRQPLRPQGRNWRNLESFVVGPCNRVAQASARSIVEAPGQGANPLVLHGPVGTGKTHLLEGIYVGLRKNQAQARVVFVTAEEFTHRFVQAMRLGKLGSFRKYYREADALLLDDLQFLSNKAATQEEFLHTLDAYLREGRQVVVTCDCHPRLADVFISELADRLVGGAAWGLTFPERDTRLALLRFKARRPGLVPVPDDVLVFLADRLRGNVRELEGALHSLRHLAQVEQHAIDLPLAQQALGDLLQHSIRVFQLADVERAVCAVLRLENGALQSKKKAWSYSHPRMLAMFLARKHTGATYTEIGQRFGGRNHSTAVAAEKKVRHWLQEKVSLKLGLREVAVREVVDQLERELMR